MPVEHAICHTVSLCPTCYRELPAFLFERDDAVFMRKECLIHGGIETLVEPDATWFFAVRQLSPTPRQNPINGIYDNIGIIEITDRCNLRCVHCYHQPDNRVEDQSLEFVVAKASAMPFNKVALMGAEPTMRRDLPELVQRIRFLGKEVAVYTNGVRLAEPALVDTLAKSGLNDCSISLHHPNYHGAKLHELQLRAVGNVHRSGIPFGQISFTVDDLDAELSGVLDTIDQLAAHGIKPLLFCIRTSADIGRAPALECELFISDLFKAVRRHAVRRGAEFLVAGNVGNNLYHVGCVYRGGIPIMLIHWPTVRNIDICQMNMGPWANFTGSTFGSFALQTILRDGLKKGWFAGRRVVTPEPYLPGEALEPLMETQSLEQEEAA